MRLWDIRQKKHSFSFNIGFQVTSVVHTGSHVFFAGIDNTVRSIDLKTNQLDLTLVGHADIVTSLAKPTEPNGFLLSNAMDNTCIIWDVKPYCPNETRVEKVLQGATHNFEKNLLKCCWSDCGQMVSAGSADRTVNIWDAQSGQLRHRLGGHKGSVNETAISRGKVASCGSDKLVIVGDINA